MAAAITLARAGWRTELFEKNAAVGGRFHGDFQGLENWSHTDDVLDTFSRWGIELDFWIKPLHEVTFYDDALKAHPVRSRRPLFYLVRRGGNEGSLERGLFQQALDVGVTFHFGARQDRVAGAAIVATGPRFGDAICVGYVFETNLPDGAWCIVSQRVAPRGYSYLLVAESRATLSSCQFTQLPRWKTYLEATVAAFQQLVPFEMKNPRPFSGYGNLYVQRRLQVGQKRYVGEAAGLQDALWGFGMRNALASGVLAAQSVLNGQDYSGSIERELRPLQRASVVNRLLWETLGDRGFAYFIRKFEPPYDARLRLGQATGVHPLKKLLFPLARWKLQQRSRYRDTACAHEGCPCVACACGQTAERPNCLSRGGTT